MNSPVIPVTSPEDNRIRLARNAAVDAHMVAFDIDELNRRGLTAFVRQAFLDGFDAGRDAASPPVSESDR